MFSKDPFSIAVKYQRTGDNQVVLHLNGFSQAECVKVHSVPLLSKTFCCVKTGEANTRTSGSKTAKGREGLGGVKQKVLSKTFRCRSEI